MRVIALSLLVCGLIFVGCAATPINPSFPITVKQGAEALRVIERDARPFDRPVVVVGGYMDPGVGAWVLARRLRRLTADPKQVIEVPVFSTLTFEACCQRVVDKLEARYPCESADSTIEVDVVGISMGGLVARAAAMPRGAGGKRLAIRRLFTISTPHRGARLAPLPTFDSRQLDMRAGSDFLCALDAAIPGAHYELIPYVRLGDAMVGAENAAPAGQYAWWVPNRALQGAHLAAHTDPRILADLARRLRGEPPFTTEPRSSLPDHTAGP